MSKLKLILPVILFGALSGCLGPKPYDYNYDGRYYRTYVNHDVYWGGPRYDRYHHRHHHRYHHRHHRHGKAVEGARSQGPAAHPQGQPAK